MGTTYFYELLNFSWSSFLIGIAYFIIFVLFGANFFYTKINKSESKFFKIGLRVHLFAGLVYCLYHQFGYKGGDTFSYYAGAAAITNFFGFDFTGYIKMLFLPNLAKEFETLVAINLIETNFAISPSLFMPLKLFSILDYFSFNSYYATTIITSFIAFLASWRFYEKIVIIYPNAPKRLFRLTIIFYPSILFWGNGISKDTICITCLFILFTRLINILILKKGVIKNFLVLLIAIYILSIVKSYISIVLIPCIFIWVSSIFISRIKNLVLKRLIFPIILFVSVVGGLFLSNSLTQLDNRFSGNDTFAEKARIQQNNLQKAGSAYSLGVISDNFLILAPLSIGTTLLRPFVWEISNPFMVLAFLESFLITLLSYFIFIKWGIKNAFGFIFKDNFIIFSLIFTLIFSAGIGASSGNFGTLVRYKIPCLPFFGISLLLLFNQYTSEVPYKFQSRLHKLLARHLLGQKAPQRF